LAKNFLIIYQGKSISRILSSPIIYLAPTLPSGSCGTPRAYKIGLRGTTLHSGKDLAVSPLLSPKELALQNSLRNRGALFCFHKKASLLAPRGLLQTGVTRYLFRKSVRTFLSGAKPERLDNLP